MASKNMFSMLIFLISMSLFSSCKEKITKDEIVNKGTIIFLHGISSAGKSTTAKILQDILDENYLYFDPDVNPAPIRIFKEGSQEGVAFEPVLVNGQQVLVVKTGAYMQKLGMVVPEMLALFADHGFNSIANFAFGGADQKLAEDFLKKYVQTLHDYKVYFINLTVSPEIAAKREQERPGGIIGLAAGQQYSLLKTLKPADFDLEIDTSTLSSAQVAQQIVDFMKSHPNPQAFERLYTYYF